MLVFCSALKAATLSLFLRPSKSGSNGDADGFVLAKMCSAQRQHEVVDSVHTPDDVLDLEVVEQESLSYLARYVWCLKNSLACQDCHAALSDEVNACRLPQLKSYTKNKTTLAIPSSAVLQVVELAEAYFRKNELPALQRK